MAILSPSGRGAALAEELGDLGVTGSNLEAGDLQRLVDTSVGRWGRIDAVVNSAGHAPKGGLLEMTDVDWQRGMNYYLLNVCIAGLVTPLMQQRQHGAIVNVCTYATFEPEAAFPTSGVFLARLAAFARLYADQYAADGLRMNNVLPGFIDSLSEKAERRERIPMSRCGRADEVAELIAFLASDKSSYITGQNIRIIGGLTRSV